MDVPKPKKSLSEELVKDPPSHFQIANELDEQVYFLVCAIETEIAGVIPKARPLPKSVLVLDEKCKET